MFKVTGVSRSKGTFKVRFANDMSRVKVLLKTGNDEIELVELDRPMSKGECATFLKTTALYQRPEYQAAIDAADAKYNGTAVVKVKQPKETKSKKPDLAEIKARAAKTEDESAEDASVESAE